MTSSAAVADGSGPSLASIVRATVDGVDLDRRTLAAALLALLGGFLATVVAVRVVVWDAMAVDLLPRRTPASRTQVTATPLEVILFQSGVGLLVGGLFAVEAVAYGARDRFAAAARLGAPLPRWVRGALVLLGVAAFPVGATVAYEIVAPALVRQVAAAAPTLSIVQLAGPATAVAVTGGLAAQVAFVAIVSAARRRARTPADG